jgi:hypothetical protein
MKLTTFSLLLAGGLSAAAAASAQIVLLEPAYRGEANTVYSHWDVFTSPAGANSPDFAGSLGTITETTGSAFLTSGGNLYNAGAASAFELAVSLSFAADTVLLQTLSQGTELNYGGVQLGYTPSGGSEVLLSWDRSITVGTEALGGFGGSAIATAYEWDLGALGVQDFTLYFEATGAHLSLDQVVMDLGPAASLSAVPEPSTYAFLLALGSFVGVVARRRLKKRDALPGTDRQTF